MTSQTIKALIAWASKHHERFAGCVIKTGTCIGVANLSRWVRVKA